MTVKARAATRCHGGGAGLGVAHLPSPCASVRHVHIGHWRLQVCLASGMHVATSLATASEANHSRTYNGGGSLPGLGRARLYLCGQRSASAASLETAG